MGLCSDPALTYLKSVGYNVVRLPRQGIEPLTVVGWTKNSAQVLGTLSDLIINPGAVLPPITVGDAADVNGKNSASLKIGIGLDVLGGLIAALGGGKLGISADWTNARTATFLFENVESASVPAIPVGRYLRDGDIDQNNPVSRPFLTGSGRLLVLVDVLKSNKISIRLDRDSGIAASIDVPVVANAVGAKLSIDSSRASEGILTFSGDHKLAFGFKCFQVIIEMGELQMVSVGAGSAFLAVADDTSKPMILIDDGANTSGFIDFDDGIG